MRVRRKENFVGFTLLETLCCLGVLCLLLGAGALSLQGLGNTDLLMRTTKEMLAEIESMAKMGRQMRTEIDVSYDQALHSLVAEGIAGDERHFIKRYHVSKNVFVTARFANPGKEFTSLTLYPNGNATPGRFTVMYEDKICEVIQALRGMRRIECK